MPIKLIQVQRKLNVGINTVVEFLHKKGFPVEDNPNTRISDEQYSLLVKEFGKDIVEKKIDLTDRKKAARDNGLGAKKEDEVVEIKTVIPEEFRPKIVMKGHIDLDGGKKQETPKENVVDEPKQDNSSSDMKQETVKETENLEKKEEESIRPADNAASRKEEIEDEKTIIVKEEKEEDKKTVEDTRKEDEHSEVASVERKEEAPEEQGDNLFRLSSAKIESKIKVTGKIDLDALNQSTRPKKKTKEEKKKERDEKLKNGAGKFSSNPSFKGNKDMGANKTAAVGEEGEGKKKRKRIKKDRIDVSNVGNMPNANFSRPNHTDDRKQRVKKPVKTEVSEEDVQKQIKETLARLTNKSNKSNKGAKYRRDKRDAAVRREHELQEQEERESKVLKLTEFVTANDLANMMDVPVTEVIGTCMSIGIMVSINQRLDAETINIVAEEFGFKTEYVSADVVEAIKTDDDDNEEDWVPRPPIVTVMGHVDHGKTSLLDNIRNANVIAGEAGGITQHIGAYNVKLPNGRRITFLDTPGHEAFTAMRARGAKVTDIAIIIVAADDSVMPQTVEAINHASAAGVPIVFAINKIDKPHANPDKIKEELANMNYLVEDWGGKYQSQEISAKKGIGVEELLDKVLLEADLLDLKANPKRRAVGSIIESSLDKGRGYVSTVLVENGTLKMGDIVLAGTHHGRIKAMFNERNQRVTEAGPSEPVLILGLDGAPQAGDTFNVLETEQEAREIANRREQLQRELGLRTH